MKRNNAIKLLSIVTFCATLTLGAVACKNNDEPTALSLAWGENTDTASYGTTYYLETVVKDVDDNLYAIDATTVKNSDGETLDVKNGKFVVADKEGYTIRYALEIDAVEYAQTVTLSVTAAKPMLALSETEEIAYVSYPYTVPECKVTDYVDGEIADYTVEVYKKTADGDVKQEADLSSGAFTPTETGEYYLLYSAENSLDVVGTAQVEFTAYTVAEKWGNTTNELLTVSKINATNITSSGAVASYAGANEAELESFSKKGYTGNASKFTWIGGTRTYSVTVPYTDAEIGFLKDYFGYTHVSMWMSYDFAEGTYFCSTGTTFHRKSGGTWSSLKQSGVKRWKKYSVDIETFKTLTNELNSLSLLKICCDSGTEGQIVKDEAYVYFGDIFFEKIVPTPTVLTVREETATSIVRGSVTGEFVYGDTLNGFTANGYTGDAVKQTWSSGSQTYYVQTDYTAETLAELGVTHVSMWLAYDYAGTGALYSTGSTTLHLKSGGTWSSLTATGVKTWQKYTVSIADFTACLENNRAKLLKICCDTGNSDVSGVTLYFGDIIFETIE